MIPHSWFGWDPFGGDLYKCMCCLNISSNLIRFKCVLGGHQEHLEEHELRGEGQQVLWPGRAFWLQQSVVRQDLPQMGNLQCVQDTALPGMGKLGSAVSAGLPILPIPISECGWGQAEMHDEGRPFSLLCKDFSSIPRDAECWTLAWAGTSEGFFSIEWHFLTWQILAVPDNFTPKEASS